MANISAKLSLNVPAITALCKGEPGTSILNGTGAPTAGIGNDGDFFINTASYQLYGPKAGVWNTPVQLNNNILAPKWDSAYNTLSSLSASWVGDNTTVSSNSARWSGVFSTTRAYSGDWNSAFNTALIVNNVSGDWDLAPNVYTTVDTYSANWNSVYNTVRGVSADNSAKLNSVFSNVNVNSAFWNKDADTQVRSLTGNWQNTYTVMYNNSANWDTAFATAGTDLGVRSLTGNWQSTYNNTYSTSARWENAFTVTSSQSANNRGVFTNVRSQSASWIDTNTTVWTYSAAWNASTDFSRYNATYSTVFSNSANWSTDDFIIICSDETTDLAPTSSIMTFRTPFAMYLNEVRASVSQASTISNIVLDISANNTSIFSTKLSINQDQTTSTTATIPAVITTNLLSDDTRINVGIDQVGLLNTGRGLKLTFKGYRT